MKTRSILSILVGAGALAPGLASAQCAFQKILPNPIEEITTAGDSLDIDSGLLIMGESGAGESNSYPGRATILQRNGSGNWVAIGEARPPIGSQDAVYCRFGESVAISGQRALVGSHFWGVANHGGAFFFENTGAYQWTQKTFAQPADIAAGDNFGHEVAMDGDHAVIAAPWADIVDGQTYTDAGAAYFYKRMPDGAWAPNGKVFEPIWFLRHNDDHFGRSVALKGDTAFVGCPDGQQFNPTDAGWIRVYKRNVSDVWATSTTLVPPNAGGQAGENYGASLAWDGEFLVVGAPGFDQGDENVGRVYVYRNDGGSWVIEASLVAPFAAQDTQFGVSVAVANGRVAVGTADQSVFTFHRAANGAWVFSEEIAAPDQGEFFGKSLAADARQVVVGDPLDNEEGFAEGGAAYAIPLSLGADIAAQAARLPLGETLVGCTTWATNDGSATCGQSNSSADVWYHLTVPGPRQVTISTIGSAYDTVLSVHASAPGNTGNQIVCNDDVAFGQLWSVVTFTAQPGMIYYVRVAGYQGAEGVYQIAATGQVLCPADLNSDLVVNFGDLNILLGQFNTTGQNLSADVDGDGDVDFADLNLLLGQFNAVCL